MEKCTRRVNSFFVQVCSKDSTGPDGGLDPFAFSFQLGLPQYMLALEADTWEAALVCLQSTASFSDLKAEDRFFHLFQENTEAEHKFEIPLSAFKDSEFLKTTFISEFQAFIRTRIQPQDQLNFNIPTCNFVDDRLFIN